MTSVRCQSPSNRASAAGAGEPDSHPDVVVAADGGHLDADPVGRPDLEHSLEDFVGEADAVGGRAAVAVGSLVGRSVEKLDDKVCRECRSESAQPLAWTAPEAGRATDSPRRCGARRRRSRPGGR